MSVKIGHASIDENNKTKNGQAGDQTGKEVCIRPWYLKPWSFVLRSKDSNKAELMAQACEKGCNNMVIGYDQNQRNTLNTQAMKVGYDLSKIKTPCECDCSSFMTVCAQAAGINIPYNNNNAPTTSTMKNSFNSTGMFDVLSNSKYLISDNYLKRGDILVKPGSHTAMALDDGIYSGNTMPILRKGIDVSKYQGNINWDKVKKNGIEFAILKIVNKDMSPDSTFEQNWKGCLNAGIDIEGVYNYSYAITVEKAKSDAQKVIDILNGRKPKVWLDVEDKCQQGLGQLLINIILGYEKIIENAGLEFGIYTGLSFYNTYIKPFASQINCDFWIARYPSTIQMLPSQNPNNDKRPDIVHPLYGWQYSSSGKVDGIQGNVDMNIGYMNVRNINVDITPNINKFVHYKCVVDTVSSNLKIRKKVDDEFLETGTSLRKGTVVKIYDICDSWARISENENLWVSISYIKSCKSLTIITNALNFRDADSTAGKILYTKYKGETSKVFAQSISTGWYLTEFGWCSANTSYVRIT